MNRNLKYCLNTLLITAALCWLIVSYGCGPIGMKPACKQDAIYAATTYGVHYPVRIMHGPVWGRDEWHMQAQAFVGGRWTWLCVSNGYITPCGQHLVGRWTPAHETDILGALVKPSVAVR